MHNKIIITCPKCNKQVKVPAGKHIRFVCPQCGEKLEYNDKLYAVPENNHHTVEEKSKGSIFGRWIIQILILLTLFPSFIILRKKIPDLDWAFDLDRILLFILLSVFLRVIFSYIRRAAIFLFVIGVGFLTYGSIWGKYGFVDVYNDYKGMIYAMYNSPSPEKIIIQNIKPFRNKTSIVEAIDYENSEVRNFAVETATKYFKDIQRTREYYKYREIIQSFSIFKEVNVVKGWNYVHDPKNQEYHAKASETLKHFSGDCDDYAIFMAACMKSIGATPRLVRTQDHLFPEILIGSKNDLDNINYLIKAVLFKEYFNGHYNEGGLYWIFNTKRKTKNTTDNILHYHIDDDGQIWLNLDYTAKYPGGKFLQKEVINILYL